MAQTSGTASVGQVWHTVRGSGVGVRAMIGVRGINQGIEAYAVGGGPGPVYGIATSGWRVRISRARCRAGVVQGKDVASGRWVPLREVDGL